MEGKVFLACGRHKSLENSITSSKIRLQLHDDDGTCGVKIKGNYKILADILLSILQYLLMETKVYSQEPWRAKQQRKGGWKISLLLQNNFSDLSDFMWYKG